MLTNIGKTFPIEPLVEQVKTLGDFGKSLLLNDCKGKLLSGPYETKPEFQNTPLGDVLAAIDNPGEARLLRLTPSETYSAHADPDDRYHVAIITNPFAYLLDFTNEKFYHIPADGGLWYMDAGVVHIAANFGPRDRIHLNIRIPLPEFKSPGYSLKLSGGDYDWKQESYIEIMTFFNRAIKAGEITGFEKVNDKEVLLNCIDVEILEPFIKKLESKGFVIEITQI
jgi:hypothetical protein